MKHLAKIQSRSVVVRSVAILSVVAIALWAWPRADAEDNADPPPLLDPGANPHAILTEAFAESGYTFQEAADLATRAIKKALGEQVQDVLIAPKPEGTVLLDPDANIHALFYLAFAESGWESATAAAHATTALMSALGIEPDPYDPMPMGDDCWAYLLNIVYCDGKDKKRTGKYVRGLCWEEVQECFNDENGDPKIPIPVPECETSEVLWMTHPLPCEDLACAWITPSSDDGMWVPCNIIDFGCQCLFDGGEVDCEVLQPLTCCHFQSACSGCPECDE